MLEPKEVRAAYWRGYTDGCADASDQNVPAFWAGLIVGGISAAITAVFIVGWLHVSA